MGGPRGCPGPGDPCRLRRRCLGPPEKVWNVPFSPLALPASSRSFPTPQTQKPRELFCCWAANENIMSAFQHLPPPPTPRPQGGLSPGLPCVQEPHMSQVGWCVPPGAVTCLPGSVGCVFQESPFCGHWYEGPSQLLLTRLSPGLLSEVGRGVHSRAEGCFREAPPSQPGCTTSVLSGFVFFIER